MSYIHLLKINFSFFIPSVSFLQNFTQTS